MARGTTNEDTISAAEALERLNELDDAENIGPARRLPDETEYTPAHLEIERLKAEFGLGEEEVSFQVFRQGSGGYRDLAFIRSVMPDQFSYEMLQAPPFNGGTFRVYIRNGSGIKRNFGIVVESPQPASIATSAGQSSDNAIASMIAAMTAGFSSLGQLIAKQQTGAAAGMGVQETIQLIGALNGLTSHAAPPPRVERDPLEMLEKMMTIQKMIMPPLAGGEATGENVMIEAIRAFGPTLAKGLQQAPQPVRSALPTPAAPAAPVTPVAQLPAPSAASAADADPEVKQAPEPTDMDLKIAIIKPAILVMAANNADPYPYANMVLDTFSDDEVAKYIDAPDWWEQLLTLVPEAKDFKSWFESLRASVLEILQDSGEGDIVGTSNASSTPAKEVN